MPSVPSRPDTEPWWKRCVAYQIYPRSFCDTDGDGVGDLEGIRRHLDHLSWLGVDAIWLSPFFRSPMRDYGYDVADYCDVDPVFGDLAAFDALVTDAHERGLRVVIDWVPNHTSEDHPWFVESRSSRHNPKRDWYVWRDARPDGAVPNNWTEALTLGPAWTLDERTGQYYLHNFLPVAARPELGEPRGRRGDARDTALLAGPRRGRLPHGRRQPHRQGPGSTRRGGGSRRTAARRAQRPGRDQGAAPRHPRRPRLVPRRPHGDRRGDAARRSTRSSITSGRTASTSPSTSRRCSDRGMPPRGAAASRRPNAPTTRGRLADLGAVQPRPTPAPVPVRRVRGGGTRRRGPRAHAAGHVFMYAGEELGLADAEIPPERRRDPGGRDGTRAPIPWDATPNHGWASSDPWLPWPPEADVAQRGGASAPTRCRRCTSTATCSPCGARRPRCASERWSCWSTPTRSSPTNGETDGSRVRVAVNFADAGVKLAGWSGADRVVVDRS